jgi:hypothetical protein
MKKRISFPTIIMIILLGILVTRIVYHIMAPPLTIEQKIKIHNSVKDTDPRFPVITKPPSSQKSVFAGDSIKTNSKN